MDSFLKYILIILWCFSFYNVGGQEHDTMYFSQPVHLDEVVINAQKEGFDVKNFINRVKNDTTFYKAFLTMRLVTYNAENDIRVYDKKGKNIKASLYSETKQIYRNGCRTMNILEEKVTGDFYDKKGNYNYYTAELYASLFFTKGTVCGENNIVHGKLEERGKGSMEKHKSKLKQLMFNPGSKVSGIPFMGDKSAIFDEGIAKMYHFRLYSEEKNGEYCYVFEAIPKEEFRTQVVYNLFRTWFRATDYSILAREYSLSYNTSVYNFDVSIYVNMKQVGNNLLPVSINYNGNWYAFSKGRERVNFKSKFHY